ncbi:hypothetical protein Tsubulata_010790 [Turnera subulata]|uniref:xanthine dehydrogenase n=2 Tax=fabids TaxID=91835 RepID=A0A9Q0G6C2_9ROSI|nr:hypothetical protein Tsubulata_010790 [Turnera subulata]
MHNEADMEQTGDDASSSGEAILYVNGVRRVLPDGLAHLTLLEYLRGMHVITVEGVGNHKSGLHPIQETLARSHGSQCGFCTPGFIMSIYALLRSNPNPPTEEQIEECLAGNLCRCTGYRPIVDAFRVFAKTDDALYTHTSSEFLCPSTGKPCSCKSETVNSTHKYEQNLACSNKYKPVSYSEVDGSRYTDKELIFPPELSLRNPSPLNLSGFGGLKWYRPLRLQHLLALKAKYPNAKLLVGNSEVGIEMRLKRIQYDVLISVAHVPELNALSVKDDGLDIGAAIKLTELLQTFRKVVNERDAHETSSCKAFIEQLKWFAGMQIRNVASVGGNICTASPISDLNPLWMAARAQFRIIDTKGNIRTTLAENFFLGYRKVDLASGEILLSVFLPWNRPFEFVKEFKQAHRRDDDIAIVNAGMRVSFEEKREEWIVSDASIIYGGVAPVSLRAIKTKEFLVGKNWNQELFQDALKVLQTDILLNEDAPGGMVEFRKSLTLSFFFKFFLFVIQQMEGKKSVTESIPASHLSAVQPFKRPSVMGSQDYEIKKHGTSVGLPEVHMSSRLQVTGEAEYVDDIPMPSNGLHAALVLSRKPHARILSIDDSKAKSSPGFAGIFLAKDVPGDNHIGPVIGVVVADTHENAKLAARKVHVDYEELPAILSIEEAVNAESFHPNTEKCLKKGDVDLFFQSGQCDKIIEGEVQVGGQEHFYLETNSSLVWTADCGNEAPQKHQKYVAHVLGLPMSKVGFTNEGKVLALDLEIYNNGGNSLDLSLPVLERAMFHSDNVYEIPNMRIRGKVCFTNFPSHTAFRGFGGPQGMIIAENWIQKIAMELNKSPEEIREKNFQGEGSMTHYSQKLENCTLATLWNELKSSSNLSMAREDVNQFNLHNRWKKRGVAMVPTKFGISFTTKFMNQAGALVHVYTDGTVLVTHGGVEMGQGLHTKVAQVAASAFNIPLSSVFISETSTDKVPNSTPTAASASSDMYGAAVLDACEQIKARMEPVASKHNFSSFAELVGACYMQRIDLSAHGFYVVPEIGFDWISGKGNPFRYFTYGVAFAEVEIDTLTGDFHTRTANIILDLAIHSSKAVGEPPFFLASAVFFAIKDAIKAARAEVGHIEWFPLDNPATPERIRMACLDEFTAPFVSSTYRPKLSKKNMESDGIESLSSEAILYVNGVRRVLPDGLAHFTLLEYLRENGRTGTKQGCGEGGCGACTEALARSHGSQCGFCTPGFIMSMYSLLRSNPNAPTEEQIEECLAGNLCRCTGYRPIADAFRVFAKTDDALYTGASSSLSLQSSKFVCPSTGKPCTCKSETVNDTHHYEQNSACCNKYGPVSYSEVDGSRYIEKEFIFPPELLLRKLTPLHLSGFGGLRWYRPLTLQHLLALRAKYPNAKLLVGNTEVGIEMRLKGIRYDALISVTHVPELNTLSVKDDGLEIGAAVRLTELLQTFRKVVIERDPHETSSCKAFIEQLKWFAATQIRNVASVGGNVCTASPISDLNPLWMASRAEFRIMDMKGNIRTTLAENFFLGYRKVDLASGEILLSVFLPWSRPFEFVKEFKQAHRRDDDIAIVNAGMRVSFEERYEEWMVSDASIVYGGVSPVSLCAVNTKEFLVGKNWNRDVLEGALKVLQTDILLKEDSPGGMVEFRKSLTLSFFFKFFLFVAQQMEGKKSIMESIPASHLSAIEPFHRPSVMGSQDYEIKKHGTSVGLPEVTGEVEYVDDIPMPSNEAKSSPGFAGIFLAKDVPGDNHIGPIVHDEELFASEFVTCVGQVIGVVVADTHENAKLAARKVRVDYQELPPILSIQEAINAKSFHSTTDMCLKKGEVDLCFQSAQCERIIEGEVQVAGQEHFYLESQISLVWTMDCGNEVHMISSTQAPHNHQKYVAHVLGHQLSKVGFTNEGKVLALDLEIYNNGGNSLDLSHCVLERAVLHSENVYEIPNMKIQSKVCITNFPSNTAFRGFGAPQAMLIAENWIQRIAVELNKSPEEIREMNFQTEGSILSYGQRLEYCTLTKLWNELKSSSNLLKARESTNLFNLHNRWKKRGVAMVPTKFGIGFPVKFANQAGALVHVHTDGTVLVTHGGVEMGQGLHTKVAQVAASVFDIPLSSVFISETSTDKVPNASATAASASSDLYGAAVLDACNQIKARMDTVASKQNFSSFAELASECYFQRIDLSAHGFYITPDIGFDWVSGKGTPFSYFTYGAAFAEVEIDTLTGDFHTRTADIILDLGHSLNPAIDIEGAFTQGLGWVALEELKRGDAAHKWIRPGSLYTCGPGTYKIPSINDVPFRFNVSLLKGHPNVKGLHSSKGVGEPPFFLASAVFFAIKDAIIAARAEVGHHEWFPLDNPATPERIRMACLDEFTEPFISSDYRPKLSV